MRQFGLIGYPIGHSFSEKYFNDKFAKESIDAVYNNFQMEDISTIEAVLANNNNIAGFNVTIPHKTNVLPFLNDTDPAIQEIGAVNVIKVTQSAEGNYLKGFNTDVVGFELSFKECLKPHHKKALVFGTGGASKAVVYVLKKLGIEYKYVSRKAADGQFTYADITEDIIKEYTLLINSTPLGMSPKVGLCPDIQYSAITADHYLYDLIYNPEETEFLLRGKAKGAAIKNGMDMLHLQADAAWEIWNNPDA